MTYQRPCITCSKECCPQNPKNNAQWLKDATDRVVNSYNMGYFAGLRSRPNNTATTKEVRDAIEESNAKNTDIMRRLADNN